ncbi:MAG: T9SS type A sorting domain-containing protein [Bacteroidetes bacterium]|nr:T9SS type A sorting domain-containing protein [Bacteroidota bacterium]
MRKLILSLSLLLGLSTFAQAQTSNFNFTGGIQTFTVPCGVTSVFIQTWGAQGAAGANGNSNLGPVVGGGGGLGGYAEGWLAVTPGDVLNIFVGGQGSTPAGGFNGGANGGSQNAGGGGGATDVRVGGTAEANRVITAGGGGGGGRGGCEGSQGPAGVGGTGGAGGGGQGANGVASPTSGGSAGGGFGGNFGAVQGASGGAGVGCSGFLGSPGATATTGSGGTGGAGQSCCCFSFSSIPGGGGGGGGQLGGGGGGGGSAGTSGCSGNDKGGGAGGGGGSSYVGGVTSGAVNPGIWLGDGQCTISWTVPIPPTHTITGPSLSCIGAFDTLTIATDPFSTFYTWTVPAGFNFVSGQNTNSIVVAAVSPGLHTIYVYGVNGNCNLVGPTDSIVINVPAPPQVTASNNGPVCLGDQATLNATGSIGGSFEWLPGNLSGDSVVVSPTSTTTYSCVITDANGCTNLSTTTVTVNTLPTITASGATICAGDSTTVNAAGGSTYSWQPGNLTGSSVLITPATTTTYTVTGTDANGCSSTAQATVTVNQLPVVTLSAQGSHCVDDASFTLTGASPAGGVFNGPGVSGNQFSPGTAGVGSHPVTYTFIDVNGCVNSATTNVVVNGCVSVGENPAFASVSYLPNPATDVLMVRWDNAKVSVNTIEVYDVNGRLVLTQATGSNNQAQLSVTELPAGTYTLTLISSASGKSNYTFVKQ